MCFFYFETEDGEVSTKPNLALALALAQTKPHRPSDSRICIRARPLVDRTQRPSWYCGRSRRHKTYLAILYSDVGLPSEIWPCPIFCYVRTHYSQKICLIHALGNPVLGASLFANSDFPPSDDRRAAVELIKSYSQWEFPRTDPSDVAPI
jgi:hypothetical protein